MVSEPVEVLAETLRQLEAALARIPQSRRPEMAVRARAELILFHLAESDVAVLIANEHGRYVHVNAAAARLTGYTTDELKTVTSADLVARIGP
jgi:PAS domain-containing protein